MFRNRNLFVSVMIIALLVALTTLLLSGCLTDPVIPYYDSVNERANQLSNTITVTGNGSHKVAPDKVMVNIAIFNEENISQEAVDKNSTNAEKVIDAMEALEIEDLKIQTISFNLDPLYNYSREGEPPEIYSYRATTVLEVSTTEITLIGEVISKAIEKGANDVSALIFGLSEDLEKESKRIALEKATLDGKSKADSIANSLDVEIIDIYYISESETYLPSPLIAKEFAVQESSGIGQVTPPRIIPNEIEVTSVVQISYIFK